METAVILTALAVFGMALVILGEIHERRELKKFEEYLKREQENTINIWTRIFKKEQPTLTDEQARDKALMFLGYRND